MLRSTLNYLTHYYVKIVFRGIYIFVIFIMVGLSGCSSESSGGQQTIVDVPNNLVQKTMIVDPDSPHANNDNDGIALVNGGTGPLKSLQLALDKANLGDIIRIHYSSSPYQEISTKNAAHLAGFTLERSGSSENPIIIEGVIANNGALPIIDQGKNNPDGTPVAGLYLRCVSHVIVRNLEIRNTHSAGITNELSGCATTNITIENTRIHDVHGTRHVAGIRLSATSNATVRNNVIYNIFKYDSEETDTYTSDFTNEVSDVVLENNQVFDTDIGVLLRTQADKSLNNITIQRNQFKQLKTAIFSINDNQHSALMENIDISYNLIADAEHAIDADLDNSSSQSVNTRIYNNTIIDISKPVFQVAGLTQINIYNNIFSDINDDVILSVKPDNGHSNQFEIIDHNLFWQTSPLTWTLDFHGTSFKRFVTLSQWQHVEAHSEPSPELHPELINAPDIFSITADPLFNNTETFDFTLQPDSPARGAGIDGGNLGAFN